MFKLTFMDLTYSVEWAGGAFKVRADQPEGVQYEGGVLAVVDCAFMEESKAGIHPSTPEFLEYLIAKRLGVDLPDPDFESVPGRIY